MLIFVPKLLTHLLLLGSGSIRRSFVWRYQGRLNTASARTENDSGHS